MLDNMLPLSDPELKTHRGGHNLLILDQLTSSTYIIIKVIRGINLYLTKVVGPDDPTAKH